MINQDNIKAWEQIPFEEIEAFGDEGDFARQKLLNPAIFKLLGDIKGKRILDAGSGTGYLSRLMAQKGAEVTAVEPASNLYRYARQREASEPLGIRYEQKDLGAIDYKREFDFVVANMVIMDIPDWQTATKKCLQALKPGATFIFSIIHPAFEERSDKEYDEKGFITVSEYLADYEIKQKYGYAFHRSLSSYLNFLIDEGATIQRLVEPQLAEELPGQSRNYHVPNFLIVQCGG